MSLAPRNLLVPFQTVKYIIFFSPYKISISLKSSAQPKSTLKICISITTATFHIQYF